MYVIFISQNGLLSRLVVLIISLEPSQNTRLAFDITFHKTYETDKTTLQFQKRRFSNIIAMCT